MAAARQLLAALQSAGPQSSTCAAALWNETAGPGVVILAAPRRPEVEGQAQAL